MEKEIIKTFIELVSFLEKTSPIVWEIYVKQQIIEGGMLFLGWGLAFCFLLIGIRLMKTKPGWCIDPSNDNFDCGIFIFIVGCLFLLILFAFLIGTGIPHLLNPEYYAIQAIKGY